MSDLKGELINLWKTISGEDYTTNEAIRLSKVVKSHQNNNTFSFIAVSDMHNYGNNNETILTALEHCGQAMKLIRKMCNIDFCVSLGDYIWGGAGTESHDEAKSEHEQMAEILADPFGYNGLPQFRLVGNHDNNPQFLDTYLTQSELYNLIGSYSDGIKPSENAEIEKGYCYYDINKVRCFFLNTCDVNFSLTSDTSKWQNNMCSITAEQLQWFCDKIEEINAKTDASEWSFAIFSHHPIDWPNGGVYDSNGDWQQLRIDYLLTVINAYLSGDSGSVSVMKNNSVTTSVTYDFSNNFAGFIAGFHGHVHNYLSDVIGERFYRVAIPNACPERNNTYASSISETYSIFGEPETYEKTAGTGEDTAFCVVTIDTVNKKIYADHYGAGYDREIDYTKTSIDVTGVTLSETIGDVHVGDSITLEATVLPSDATNKSVTWNSSDDSVATVSNGVVKVVGEGTATITVTTEDGGYTATYTLTATRVNLLTTAVGTDGEIYNGVGYKDGYRINSSNAETVDSNTSLTGFIPVSKGDTLEFTNFGTGLGTTTSNPNYSYLRMTAYDSDFNVLATSVKASAILTQWMSNFSAHADITADGGGYMTKITFKATTLLANLAYIRLTVNGKISEMSNPGIYKS